MIATIASTYMSYTGYWLLATLLLLPVATLPPVYLYLCTPVQHMHSYTDISHIWPLLLYILVAVADDNNNNRNIYVMM